MPRTDPAPLPRPTPGQRLKGWIGGMRGVPWPSLALFLLVAGSLLAAVLVIISTVDAERAQRAQAHREALARIGKQRDRFRQAEPRRPDQHDARDMRCALRRCDNVFEHRPDQPFARIGCERAGKAALARTARLDRDDRPGHGIAGASVRLVKRMPAPSAL